MISGRRSPTGKSAERPTPAYRRLHKPFYSIITKTFSYENDYDMYKLKPRIPVLQRMDEATGLTAEERIIKFCEAPRSKNEIAGLIGVSVKCSTWFWDKYLQPLIDTGKLKTTLPNRRTSNQRLVSAFCREY